MKKSLKIKKEFLIVGFGLHGLNLIYRLFVNHYDAITTSDLFQQAILEILCGVGGLMGSAVLALGVILAIRQRASQCPLCGAPARSRADRYCRTCGAAIKK